MTLVSPPLAFVLISVPVVEHALPTGLPLLPHAVIDGAILPRHPPFAMAKAATHLPRVDGTRALVGDRLINLGRIWVKLLAVYQGLNDSIFYEVPFMFHLHLTFEHPVLPSFKVAAHHSLNFHEHERLLAEHRCACTSLTREGSPDWHQRRLVALGGPVRRRVGGVLLVRQDRGRRVGFDLQIWLYRTLR